MKLFRGHSPCGKQRFREIATPDWVGTLRRCTHTQQYVRFVKSPTQSGVAISRKRCFPHGSQSCCNRTARSLVVQSLLYLGTVLACKTSPRRCKLESPPAKEHSLLRTQAFDAPALSAHAASISTKRPKLRDFME
jgi:hypothetical protein